MILKDLPSQPEHKFHEEKTCVLLVARTPEPRTKPNSLHHRPLKGKDKVQLWFPLKPPNSLNSFLKGQRNHPYPFPALEPVFYKMFGHFQQ